MRGHARLDFLVISSFSLLVPSCGDDDGDGATADATVSHDAPILDAAADVDADVPTADAGPTPDAPPGGFQVIGVAVAGSPAQSDAVVAWVVSVGADTSYKFGDGLQSGDSFVVTMSGDLPTAARNLVAGQADFGVGVIALVATGTPFPDGTITIDPPVLGVSRRHAIIYRGATDPATVVTWTAAFPIGYSCGVCVDNAGGFDTFAPIDCALVEVTSDTQVPFCEWT